MTLPPLHTPIQHTGGATCPVHPRTMIITEPGQKPFWAERLTDDWSWVTTYTIIARAPADRIAELEAALAACVQMLDALVKESGRQVEYGEEDPFRRGEWFELADLEMIDRARATLKGTSHV